MLTSRRGYMRADLLIKRVDELLNQGQLVLSTDHTSRFGGNCVDSASMSGFRSAVLSFIDRIYGQQHPHYIQFSKHTGDTYTWNAKNGVAILEAIRAEISGGWLISIKGLIAAEIFTDFLEMAEYLISNGYKDPAAVMAGSVLEEHLRQLCKKESIDTEETKEDRQVPKKADRLNADLAKAEVYSKLDHKQITAWLDLRNNAAHGKYELYTEEQVRHFISGLTEFMTRMSL